MDLGVVSLASNFLILIQDCTDLNTLERFCLGSFIFHKGLDFKRSCIFQYVLCLRIDLYCMTEAVPWVTEGLFLQERGEAAELWCPLLGHTTAWKGQLLTPVTHSPLSIPKWKENWSCILQFGIAWGEFGISVRLDHRLSHLNSDMPGGGSTGSG